MSINTEILRRVRRMILTSLYTFKPLCLFIIYNLTVMHETIVNFQLKSKHVAMGLFYLTTISNISA